MPNLEDYLPFFNKTSFRPGQKDVIEAILAGRDVMAIWPTGAGKSLTYQLPAMLMPHLTIVVSPLISLMQDQVSSLFCLGFANAACITSEHSMQDRRFVMESVRQGKIKLLFISPERLTSDSFINELEGTEVSLLAVDEAHCISQWGHDFRPDYLNIGRAAVMLKPRSILAVTATAPPQICAQIKTLLGMRDPLVNKLPLIRPNLSLEAVPCEQDKKEAMVLSRLCRRGGLPAIVYARKRRDTERLALYLNKYGLPAACYHAGLDAWQKEETLARFISGDISVVTATVAFGMGIDKNDVRQIIHISPPDSPEAYYQETGRAGRDGGESECVMLYSKDDADNLMMSLADKYPPQDTYEELYNALEAYPPAQIRPHCLSVSPGGWRMVLGALCGPSYSMDIVNEIKVTKDAGWHYLQSLKNAEINRARHMLEYINTRQCRLQDLLRYFGEEAKPCGKCDNCRKLALQALPQRSPSLFDLPYAKIKEKLKCAGAFLKAIPEICCLQSNPT